MRRLAFSLASLVLAACANAPEPQPTSPPSPPEAPAPTPEPAADTCGASGLQHLVGRPRAEAPVAVRPEYQRVTCTTCPVTLDFNENRLNIFFDAATGRIQEIRCG